MNTASSAFRKQNITLVIALLLVFLGSFLANAIQTNGWTVQVKDVRWVGTNGIEMSALLYIPSSVYGKDAKGAAVINPAPGIVAIHGYINSRETQDGFAIEYARRGYVVLASDQTGHGYSDPPAFANGFGGPDALAYIRTLNIVDPKNIGLSGHSMGGWASVVAAQTYPNDYAAMVLEGSSTGTYGGKVGDATFPHNLGLVYSKFDEFSTLMWGVAIPGNVGQGDKLKAQFATTDPVQPNKLYGSIADGTARYWYQPTTNHPGDTVSTEAIGDAVDWFSKTLKGSNGLDPSNQIWYWKELGTLVAAIGFVLFLFPFGAMLLRTKFFGTLEEPAPAGKPATGVGWWVAAVLTILIPVLTYYKFIGLPGTLQITASAFWPQNITTTVVFWALGNGLIFLVLFLLWHFFMGGKKAGNTFASYGLTWANGKLELAKIGKSLLLAALITAGGYLLLVLVDFFFKTDFRLYVFAVKLFSPLQFQIYLAYLIPFIIFFGISGLALAGQMRLIGKDGEVSLWKAILVNVALMVLGFVVFLLWEYIPLYGGGMQTDALDPNGPLYVIVAYQFIPMLGIAGAIATYYFRKTGHIYVGAFLSAMIVTWMIVAGTATHFQF